MSNVPCCVKFAGPGTGEPFVGLREMELKILFHWSNVNN
jgi:hypothetical protein